jgi:phosphatidylglycerol:prolipoprotein diacylglycerol transferase
LLRGWRGRGNRKAFGFSFLVLRLVQHLVQRSARRRQASVHETIALMLIHPQFDPIALQIGPLAIRWYGLMYLLGFGLFWWLGRKRLKRPDIAAATRLDSQSLDDLLFFGVLGVVLGGRLGYVLFYKPLYYLEHPLESFAVWQGGMAFHGGLIGVMTALWLFCRVRGLRFFAVMDFVAPLVPLGLAAGRMGNFINGELWGRPSDLPWAMVFPQAGDALARHPSQLYQFAAEGLLLFALLWWWSGRRRAIGEISGLFLVGYGSARFLVEFARQPDAFLGTLAAGMSMGQWLSLPMILIGIPMILVARKQALTVDLAMTGRAKG